MLSKEFEQQIRNMASHGGPPFSSATVADLLAEIDALRALCARARIRIENLCDDNGSHELECEWCGPIMNELKAAGE